MSLVPLTNIDSIPMVVDSHQPSLSSYDLQSNVIVSTEIIKKSNIRSGAGSKVYRAQLQTRSCLHYPTLKQCLECRHRIPLTSEQIETDLKENEIDWSCRFFKYRKYRLDVESGTSIEAGFTGAKDVRASDTRMWVPPFRVSDLDLDTALRIVDLIGDEFCAMIEHESTVMRRYNADHNGCKVNSNDCTQLNDIRSLQEHSTWKRLVSGVRELCDVCATTLFNVHFVCQKCGFVICTDCYASRRQQQNHRGQQIKAEETLTTKSDSPQEWIKCTDRQEHRIEDLSLAHIIAGDSMELLWRRLHERRPKCACKRPLSIHASDSDNAAVSTNIYEQNFYNHYALSEDVLPLTRSRQQKWLEQVIQLLPCVTETSSTRQEQQAHHIESQLVIRNKRKAIDTSVNQRRKKQRGQVDKMSNTEHEAPHTWEFDERLLILLDASAHKANDALFRQQWLSGRPVLVRGVHKQLDKRLWSLKAFSKRLIELANDSDTPLVELVDCRTGVVHLRSMADYWHEFGTDHDEDYLEKSSTVNDIIYPINITRDKKINRQGHQSDRPAWKLKDWPPGDDFAKILPDHFADLMRALPLNHYTSRGSRLNLATRLPKQMVVPDLGPKLYSAYGINAWPSRATTNLHIDISDAINVMVCVVESHVSRTQKQKQALKKQTTKMISTASKRFFSTKENKQHKQENDRDSDDDTIDGALWHIFEACDAPKVSRFLLREAQLRDIPTTSNPIHDQMWYLDDDMLERLYQSEKVRAYTIRQRLGDAILIPAGAPHQVKNLRSCIKIANDFVSPEHVRECLHLTQQFRALPATHINREDKLQIKNMIYHTIKEVVRVLEQYSDIKKTNK